jgi:hypothetical protein
MYQTPHSAAQLPPVSQTQFYIPVPIPAQYPVQQNATFILDEYSNQYRQHTDWMILSILLIPALIGLLVFMYLSGQDSQLRQKVAALGVDPSTWEAPLKKHRNRAITRIFVILLLGVAAIGGYVAWVSMKTGPVR